MSWFRPTKWERFRDYVLMALACVGISLISIIEMIVWLALRLGIVYGVYWLFTNV